MGSQSTRIGQKGEELAEKYLRGKGYRILERNYHIRGGELDIVAKKDSILLFVEVKTRRGGLFGAPEEALTRGKKHKLLRAINSYLWSRPGVDWRCDLIAIRLRGANAYIQHFSDVLSE